MPEEDFEHKLLYHPDQIFKGWRYAAWRQNFKSWSRDYDITVMKTEALVKRFEYASRLIQEGRWGEGKI